MCRRVLCALCIVGMVVIAFILAGEVSADDSDEKQPGNDKKPGVVHDCRYDPDNGGSSSGIFPSDDVFRPLIADPKQPQFFAIWQATTKRSNGTSNNSANIGSVALGENFGLYTKRYGCDGVQISLLTGVFSQFNLDEPNAELINTDFNVGVPLTWRMENWSARVRYYHQSSHVGDEFLLNHPKVNVMTYTYEEVEAILSYDYKWARLYVGGGVLVHREPDWIDRNRVQWGFDVRAPSIASKLGWVFERMRVIPVLAVDFKALEELDWIINTNLLAGMELSRPDSLRRFRIMFNYYHGYNPYGQFISQKIESFGIGAYFLF